MGLPFSLLVWTLLKTDEWMLDLTDAGDERRSLSPFSWAGLGLARLAGQYWNCWFSYDDPMNQVHGPG